MRIIKIKENADIFISAFSNNIQSSERTEKAAKRREEKKAEEEKAAERRAERKERMEGTFTVSATGTDVKSVTQNIVAAASGTSSFTGGSFDIKA